MVLMRVMGDSMEPEIKNADVVLIDQSQRQLGHGQVFAVGVEDLVYLKIIDTLSGKLLLKSFNPAYPHRNRRQGRPRRRRQDNRPCDLGGKGTALEK
ncbi:S24 family peptidase [Alkalidesulfovibrio alkalitolerans]|uniref:S24 family peptidase n=1 Tax=Alkalidesulfovibrio alkalitolerans TaxID=293256 RepID=UPI002E222EA1